MKWQKATEMLCDKKNTSKVKEKFYKVVVKQVVIFRHLSFEQLIKKKKLKHHSRCVV